jgi:hypothetical protein
VAPGAVRGARFPESHICQKRADIEHLSFVGEREGGLLEGKKVGKAL